MAEITTSQIGNGTTAYGSDIVVKDLDLDVSNRVKDDTPVLNMAMSKKRKVNSTLPLWTDDIYRLPSAQAVQEGAAVSTANAESNSRYNLANYTQIFQTTIAASGTARAVMQSGGDPQAYQEVKQLIELMFDVEQQLVRADQIGTQYSGQAGTAITNPTTAQTGGRRMGSLASFAGTLSFNPSDANIANITTNTNNASSDSSTANAGNLVINSNRKVSRFSYWHTRQCCNACADQANINDWLHLQSLNLLLHFSRLRYQGRTTINKISVLNLLNQFSA